MEYRVGTNAQHPPPSWAHTQGKDESVLKGLWGEGQCDSELQCCLPHMDGGSFRIAEQPGYIRSPQ